MIPKNSLKPQRGLGQAITRQRRKAVEEVERQRRAREERRRQSALHEISRHMHRNTEAEEDLRWAVNLMASVVSNQTAVIRSYGLRQPVNAKVLPTAWWRTARIEAWTDFTSITVNWPQSQMPSRNATHESIIDCVAQMRGVLQHELGHILFTTPFPELVAATLENESNPWYGAANKSALHRPWNMLEDQRMESAMVKAVPRLASYFTSMTLAHIIDQSDDESVSVSWLLLAGREYLPSEVRSLSRQAFDQRHDQSGVNASTEWLTIVNDYKRATTHEGLIAAVIAAKAFLERVLPNGEGGNGTTEHKPRGGYEPPSEDEQDPSKGATEPEDDESAGDSPAEGEGDDGESDEGEPQSAGDSDDDGDEGDEGQNSGESTSESDSAEDATNEATGSTSQGRSKSLKEVIEQAHEQAKQEVRQDKENHSVVADAYEHSNSGGSLADATFSGTDMTPEQVDSAHRTAVGMEQALSDFVTASQPVWMSHQERGIIDPIAFRTKAVGDTDYNRALVGEASSGLNLHVSMLCDVSVSMQGDPMVALSEAIYATAIACQRLGIGTSFTLWSDRSETYRIWRDTEATPTMWEPLGGTDPTIALDDLEGHNEEGADDHLVLIFTDGAWGDEAEYDLQKWAAPGRHFVLVRYGAWNAPSYGADEVVDIRSIDQLPMELTRAIAGLLA